MVRKIDAINGLRGIAIFGVIFHHAFSKYIEPGNISPRLSALPVPQAFLSNGWLGVNLFFVLSGFVLALPYHAGVRTMSSRKDLFEFYARRLRRIAPLCYISFLVLAIFATTFPSKSDFFEEALFVAFFATGFSANHWAPDANWVLWSLSVEACFSIIFPAIMFSIDRIGMFRVLICSVIVALVVRFIGVMPDFDSGNLYLNPVKDSFAGRVDEFVMGVAISFWWSREKAFLRFDPKLSFIFGVIIVYLSCQAWNFCYLNPDARWVRALINMPLDIGLVLIIAASISKRFLFVSRIIFPVPVRILGLMCYSLYIWHGKMLLMMKDTAVDSLMQYSFCLLILSALSYRYIEMGHFKDIKKVFSI